MYVRMNNLAILFYINAFTMNKHAHTAL